MALTHVYVLATNRIPDLFQKIRDGQAPDQFSHQLLKDWGFSSSNDRAFIPLLKALNFLTPDGRPTQRYHSYRDHSESKRIMGEAIKDAYGDIFLIKANPTNADKAAVEGKFKSFHNVSDNVAQLMAKTFFALLALADLSGHTTRKQKPDVMPSQEKEIQTNHELSNRIALSGLHYNIQIHLPATKDVEVYNAIFKSLKEHLIAK
jgi:Family of unknown function (DUF5343)